MTENTSELLTNCMHAALSLLKYRMRSTAELKQKLKAKGFDEICIIQVIKKLEENSLLNDERLARALIHDQIHLQHYGPIRLKQTLKKHGINDELLKTICEAELDEISEKEMIEFLLDKKHVKKNVKMPKKEKTKLIHFLLRKGHRWSMIQKIFEEWNI